MIDLVSYGRHNMKIGVSIYDIVVIDLVSYGRHNLHAFDLLTMTGRGEYRILNKEFRIMKWIALSLRTLGTSSPQS